MAIIRGDNLKGRGPYFFIE